jgi:hypothetical protein
MKSEKPTPTSLKEESGASVGNDVEAAGPAKRPATTAAATVSLRVPPGRGPKR